MKLVFLDFDGVLNGERWIRTQTLSPLYPALNPACADRVQRLCAETGASLVISSSWREIRTWDDNLEKTRAPRPLEDIVGWLRAVGITAEVVGATTGRRFSVDMKENRALQIRAWVNENSGITRWCALDDFKLTDLLGRGIVTHPEHGIRDEDVRLAISMLGAVTP